MPRRSKGPRLWFDKRKRLYVIRDGSRKRGTGCGEGERGRAEVALRDYIAAKYEPAGGSDPRVVLVADVLTLYLREIAPGQASSATTKYAAKHLLDWWNTRPLIDVKRSTCRAYAEHRKKQGIPQAKTPKALKRRVGDGTVRRELTVLQAAINAYHAEHTLTSVPVVTLPQPPPARDRWLTRDEAAAFLRAARKHPTASARVALIRFFLIAVYTGTRSGVIRKLDWMPTTRGAWVDLEAGVMHRKGARERETNKRRPPLRLPPPLLGHLRRWHKIDSDPLPDPDKPGKMLPPKVHVIGLFKRQRRAWAWACKKAGLGPEVTPHITRHTAATWLMRARADLWDAAGYLGMSPEILWRVYGHHHPDWQTDVAARAGQKRDRLT